MQNKKYDKVKNFFDNRLWSINRVKDAVVKEWITPEEYKTITNEPYTEE